MPRKRQATGRRRGRPSYDDDDRPLLLAMALARQRGQAASDFEAARLVVHRAKGFSATDRLFRKYRRQRPQLLREAVAIEARAAKAMAIIRDNARLIGQPAVPANQQVRDILRNAVGQLGVPADQRVRDILREARPQLELPPDLRVRMMLRDLLSDDFPRSPGRFSPNKEPQEDK